MTAKADILVIGKGLVGAAAARYLSAGSRKVVLAGPDEPGAGETPQVYAAHYDQARVQRQIGWERIWTDLNMASVRAYEELQRSTGIRFHQTPGCLYVNPYGSDDYLAQADALLQKGTVAGQMLQTVEEIEALFPCFRFPVSCKGMFEPAPSGYINPRALVKAQCIAAEKQGCRIIRSVVSRLDRVGEGFVAHAGEHRIEAAQVLVATGSFANHLGILKESVAMRSKGETVLLARLSERDAADLKGMPSLLYEWNEKDIEGVYVLPPVAYPDGGIYLKIGANFPEDPVFHDLEAVQTWFHSGDSERFAPRLEHMLKSILPGVQWIETVTKRCIVSYTPHRRPYIGQTREQGLYVAGGCNGYSAMCSDAMGMVAAELVSTGRYPADFSEADLRLAYGTSVDHHG